MKWLGYHILMLIRREFLGWGEAVLPVVAARLLARFGEGLSGVTVVLPTGRAGRRLQELLVSGAGAGDRGAVMLPGVLTPGGLAGALLEMEGVADAVVSRWAWGEAVRRLGGGGVSTIGSIQKLK